ncbi:hypothetical protein JOQ06_011517, partial [Pogonophryne albipinna]
ELKFPDAHTPTKLHTRAYAIQSGTLKDWVLSVRPQRQQSLSLSLSKSDVSESVACSGAVNKACPHGAPMARSAEELIEDLRQSQQRKDRDDKDTTAVSLDAQPLSRLHFYGHAFRPAAPRLRICGVVIPGAQVCVFTCVRFKIEQLPQPYRNHKLKNHLCQSQLDHDPMSTIALDLSWLRPQIESLDYCSRLWHQSQHGKR